MNKTGNKKNKVNAKKYSPAETIVGESEHITNGVSEKKKKKAKLQVPITETNGLLPEDCCSKLDSPLDDQSSTQLNSVIVDKPETIKSGAKKKKVKPAAKLDSNDNDLYRLPKLELDVEPVASSSSKIEEIISTIEQLSLEPPTQKPVIDFIQYESELQMPMIMKIIQKDLSEPYSIYTYRYFIHNWPKLCFLAMCEEDCVGAIVCKLDLHRKVVNRGYIAMLAVDQSYRKLRIGSTLVEMAISEMIKGEADEVVLETEVTNKPALQLYEKLGFVRDKRLFRYYLNGVDALRLKLWLR